MKEQKIIQTHKLIKNNNEMTAQIQVKINKKIQNL